MPTNRTPTQIAPHTSDDLLDMNFSPAEKLLSAICKKSLLAWIEGASLPYTMHGGKTQLNKALRYLLEGSE